MRGRVASPRRVACPGNIRYRYFFSASRVCEIFSLVFFSLTFLLIFFRYLFFSAVFNVAI